MRLTREVFPETQQLLQRLYRQSRHHQVRQRAHCILLSSKDYSMAQLMDIFNVSRKTLYNWFNNWETQGVVGLYNRPGRGAKAPSVQFKSNRFENGCNTNRDNSNKLCRRFKRSGALPSVPRR